MGGVGHNLSKKKKERLWIISNFAFQSQSPVKFSEITEL